MEMFYLTKHSTLLSYVAKDHSESDGDIGKPLPTLYEVLFQLAARNLSYTKYGNILFNDALNTFYLRLYGVRHMVKDHSDSERGNPLPPHGLLFPISSKECFVYIIPDRIVGLHSTLCYTSCVGLAGTYSSMGPTTLLAPSECM